MRVGDLKDQIGTPSPRPVLLCQCCGETYSADKSDYFIFGDSHVLTCCEEPLIRVTKRTIYEPS